MEALKSFTRWALKPVVPPIDLAGKPSTVLCPCCRCITGDALVSEAGFRHVEKLKDLWRTWQNCSLCHVIFHHFVDRGALGEQTNLRLKFTWPGSSNWSDKYPLGVLMLVCDGLDGKQVSTVDCLYIVTPIGDPAESLGFPPVNRSLSNTRSNETFEFIHRCMDECLHKHECEQPFSSEQGAGPKDRSQWPARLIYVNPNRDSNEDHIRVIDITESCPRFMTLSHCWGEPRRTLLDKDKTKKDNLHQRKLSIPVKTLCRNFQDAVEITRRLGVEHLWIDALCIIQDDVEDWDRESVKMGSIYQNSVLTISANLKGDSSGGCFNRRSVPHDLLPMKMREKIKVRSIEITTTQPGRQQSSLLFHYERQSSDPAPLRASPLENRGWIFQERVLSPRTIHFTPSQAVWECREMYKLEDMLPSPVPNYKGTRPALIAQGRRGALNVVDHWYREIVCSDYSRRLFTRPADRLVAIAGLAKTWQPIIGDEYIAGIWRSSMAFGLCWMRDRSRTLALTAAQRRYPTWTWASHDGFIAWWPSHENFEADRRFRFHGESLQYRNQKAATMFSVDGGFVRIEGCVSEIAICSLPDKTEVDASVENRAAKLFIDTVDPGDFAQLPMRFPVVAIGHASDTRHWVRTYLLVLGSVASQAHSYERIGFAFVDFQTVEERAGFWDGIDSQQILLF
ncbi:heterokaryon incompatibility protein-domain-containing protein [Nemania abortiva]|nr:heterokaryon incompatibility protein-domain-containing protein [Nemania abortiva]